MNSKEKISIIKQSKKCQKILISIDAFNSSANYEIFFPEKKINNNLGYIIEETPEGPEEKNEIIVEDKPEENYDYKNCCTIEEAINWSKNYFINNFILYIKYLNELIDKSHSETEMKNYIDEIFVIEKEKENKIIKILT